MLHFRFDRTPHALEGGSSSLSPIRFVTVTGMMSYSGFAGGEGAGPGYDAEAVAAGEAPPQQAAQGTRLELWRNDGTHEIGPEFEYEHLDQLGGGPGSMDAFINACNGKEYFRGSGPIEGLKAVATIDAMYRSLLSGQPEAVADVFDF